MTERTFSDSLFGVPMPRDSDGKPLITMKSVRQCLGKFNLLIHTFGVVAVRPDGTVPRRGGAGGLTDGTTYRLYPDVARLIPSSYSILEISNWESSESATFRIRGFPKFFGATEVDDDDTAESAILWEMYRPSEYDSMLVTEKLNGKSVVMTVFSFGGENWIFGGSKTRHRAIRLDHAEEDLETLDETDQDTVKPMLTDFYQMYRNCPRQRQLELILTARRTGAFLRDTTCDLGVDPHTLCGEWNDGHHQIPLPPNTPHHIKWFGLLRSDARFTDDPSMTGDIVGNLKLLSDFFPGKVVKYCLMGPRSSYQAPDRSPDAWSEGSVIHYILRGQTVSVEKHKTDWYILIQMLREIIRGAKTSERLESGYRTEIRERILQRNSVLGLHPGMVSLWQRLFCGFVEWMLIEHISPAEVGFNVTHRGMGNMWRDYMMTHSNIQDPDVEFREPGSSWSKMTLVEASGEAQ